METETTVQIWCDHCWEKRDATVPTAGFSADTIAVCQTCNHTSAVVWCPNCGKRHEIPQPNTEREVWVCPTCKEERRFSAELLIRFFENQIAIIGPTTTTENSSPVTGATRHRFRRAGFIVLLLFLVPWIGQQYEAIRYRQRARAYQQAIREPVGGDFSATPLPPTPPAPVFVERDSAEQISRAMPSGSIYYAFGRNEDVTNEWNYRRYYASLGESRPVLNTLDLPLQVTNPALSPAGTHQIRKENDYSLLLTSGDGAILDRFENGGIYGDVSWAQNSRKILFDVMQNGQRNLYTMYLDGSKVERLTDGANNYGARWIDGLLKIVFISDRSGQPQIHTQAVVGGEVELIHPMAGEIRKVEISPDGYFVAFEHYDPELENVDLWFGRIDGERLIRITDTPTISESLLGWTP